MMLSTLINFIRKDSFKVLHLFLVSICIFALAFAYFIEYIMGVSPCPLCIYQRFPYLFIIKISFVTLLINKINKYSLFFIVVNLLSACILASYHSGIERGIFKPSSLCSTLLHIPKHLSINDIREMFYSQPIATCSLATAKFLALSMTEWNLLLNMFLLTLVLVVWLYPDSNKG